MGAVRRQRRQTEIYSSGRASPGPCDRVSSESLLSHPGLARSVDEETHERSDSRSLSRRPILDPTLGVSVATLANTDISAIV